MTRPILALLTSVLVLAGCGGPVTAPGQDGGGSAGGAGGGSATGGGDGGVISQLLAAHNAVRASAMPVANPALAPMTWDSSAASVAQAWADNCVYMHNAGRGNVGENLFAGSGGGYTATQVVDSWASEQTDYTYSTNTCAPGKVCGHYTQIVWRASLGLGCGSKVCTTGSPFGSGSWLFWVCDYSPPGNFVGMKPY